MEFQNIEDIFLGLDEWSYDIEQEYKTNGFVEPKKKRQYVNICATRDKYYDIYLERLDRLNNSSREHYFNTRYYPIGKSCLKRFPPPKPVKQI